MFTKDYVYCAMLKQLWATKTSVDSSQGKEEVSWYDLDGGQEKTNQDEQQTHAGIKSTNQWSEVDLSQANRTQREVYTGYR